MQATFPIPVLNEESIIVPNTERVIRFLRKKKLKFEIFLCNNGSTDGTLELARKLAKKHREVRVISVPRKGVGRVFKKAVKQAKYDNIISLDMDLSVELDFIPRAMKLLENNDIVIGSKKMGTQERPFLRRLPSTIFIFLVKLFLGLPYRDYSMAAKAYKKNAILKNIDKVDYGTSYVIDLIYFAKREKRKMVEIPVSCNDKRESKFNILNESLYRFKNLLKLFVKYF